MGKGPIMKTSIAILVVGSCLLGGMWAMAAEEPKDDKPSDLDALKERIQVLEDRVAALEKERMVIPRVPRTPETRRPVPDRQVPKGWVPRDFNGHRYYVIPIAQDPNKPLPTK